MWRGVAAGGARSVGGSERGGTTTSYVSKSKLNDRLYFSFLRVYCTAHLNSEMVDCGTCYFLSEISGLQ